MGEVKEPKLYMFESTTTFAIWTTDIEEVVLNYQFPDFIDCKSIVGEPEYDGGSQTYWVVDKDWNPVDTKEKVE